MGLPDLYGVLGVDQYASSSQLKEAYQAKEKQVKLLQFLISGKVVLVSTCLPAKCYLCVSPDLVQQQPVTLSGSQSILQ